MSSDPSPLEHRAEEIRGVYTRQAAAFDAVRSRSLFEKPWLDRVLAVTKSGDTVLDVGCGAGEPVARYFLENGRRVCGVDFSATMLAIFATRFPESRRVSADMRALELGETFAAVVAWDSFFHLTRAAQRDVLPRLCRHVAPGGVLLATVGPDAGEVMGSVGGEPVYHASLSPAEYAGILDRAGFDVVAFSPEDRECAGRSVLFARRR